MSLPSGYKRLEYIQSTGTQYVNTGFKPSGEDMRVVFDFMYTAAHGSHSLYGVQTSSTEFSITAFSNPKFYVGTSWDLLPQTTSLNVRYLLDAHANNGTLTVSLDGTSGSSAYSGSLDKTLNLSLFGNNMNGSTVQLVSARLYSCQIYDNGTLVRDFIPCRKPDGTIGLLDDVNSVFYGNAGTGTFTAGPEISYEPATPTNFTASVSGQTVALSWAAAANAAGYRLKRNGVQIAEQTGTTYTDTVPDEIALCTYTLTAYNDDGESAAAALTVILRLDLITDRTSADVENETDKGFYNASDLNRVGAAVEYIAGRFTALGYACPVTVKKDWLTSDAPTASQMEAYRQNIVTLRGQIAVMQSTPEAPASMEGLNYVKANNIEQILLDLDALIDKLIKSWYFSGELYAGEV